MAVKVETLKQISTQQPGKPGSYYVGTFLRYLLLSLIGLVLFMPFILAALGTFKTDAEIIAFPPRLFPRTIPTPSLAGGVSARKTHRSQSG